MQGVPKKLQRFNLNFKSLECFLGHPVLFLSLAKKCLLKGIFWSGASVGTLIIFTLAGYVSDHLGWEAVFYVTGGLSLVWVVFWFILVSDTPAQHPRISQGRFQKNVVH